MEEIMDIISADKQDDFIPGTILAANRDGLFVKTADGVIQLLEIQFDSARRMPVRDYLLGHSLDKGVILT